eukprot:2533146-Pyramimonas_sp.AAC.1
MTTPWPEGGAARGVPKCCVVGMVSQWFSRGATCFQGGPDVARTWFGRGLRHSRVGGSASTSQSAL